MKLIEHSQAPGFSVIDIHGKNITLSDYKERKVLLCFFRYAGCPFCNLTFLKLLERYPELSQKGLNIITFFQSPKDSVIRYIDKLIPPVPVIADPDKEIYNLYGITSSIIGWPSSLLQTPMVIGGILNREIVQGKIDGDPNLLPASFLIGPPDLTVYSAYYGTNFSDFIPAIDVEKFVLTT